MNTQTIPAATKQTKKKGRGCFCNACKKEGFRRSELSDNWLCKVCAAIPGVRGYQDPATRGLRLGSPEYWERTKAQLAREMVTDDEDPQPKPTTTESSPKEEEDPRLRRYLEWTVAHSSLPPITRLVHRVVLLHMGAQGAACRVGYRRLAVDSSLSQRRVTEIIRREAQAKRMSRFGGPGHRKTKVIMSPDPQACKVLHTMWPKHEDVGGAAWRFGWIRALVADRALNARTKMVALGVELLMTSCGQPHRWTTIRELARLTGCSADIVRRALKLLAGGDDPWLGITRRWGRHHGGVLLDLRQNAAADTWERQHGYDENANF